MSVIDDEYLKRHQTLLRLAEGEALELARDIKLIHTKVLQLIQERGYRSEKQVELMIETELKSFYYNNWPDEIEEMAVDVIKTELFFHRDTLAKFVAEAAAVEVTNTLRVQALAKAKSKTFQGHRISTWVKKQFRVESNEIMDLLNKGYVGGVPIAETTRKIQGLLGRAERDVKTITRAHFMQTANTAKEEFYKKNKQHISGYLWLSTLDSRTTPLICGVRDQKKYDTDFQPVGHSLPWGAGPGAIHWNCRSGSVPYLKGTIINAPRPSVGPGENYERGSNKTRTGRVRKAHRDATNKGIYDVKQVAGTTQYEAWLRNISKSNIDYVADVFGSMKKAEDFAAGKSLKELLLESPVQNPIKPKRKK